MFNISKPSGLERKRDFHGEAPAAKHEYRLRRYGPLRMAGTVWEESVSEKLKKAAKARYATQNSGVGFGGGDKFGPDDNYATQESLNNTPDPKGYRV